MKPRCLILVTATLAVGLAPTGAARAAGFALPEQSVKGLGRAFAGAAAVAEDAATVFFNPAGLTRLRGYQGQIAATLIAPSVKFKDQASTAALGQRPSGRSSSNGGKTQFAPNLYYAMALANRLKFGLGVNRPWGIHTDYDKDWVGRYHAVETEIDSVNINPSLGYELSQNLSIGAGLSAQYVDTTFSNAIDVGSLAFLAGVSEAKPSSRALDGFSEVKADDWSFGYNLGLLYEMGLGTRIGVSYRSKISHNLKGDREVDVPDLLQQTSGLGSSHSVNTKVDLTLPENVSISGYHQLSPLWAVMADATWTRWSRFGKLRFDFADGGSVTEPQDWGDGWRYSLGLSYRHSPAWTLRTGFAYDQAAVSGSRKRSPRFPAHSMRWLSVGASYHPSAYFMFDIGYTYRSASDGDIDSTEVVTGSLSGQPVGNTLDGEYEADAHVFGAQVQWLF